MVVLKKGDHAIFLYTVYGGTHEFCVEYLQHWGVEFTLVDSTDATNYARALKPNTRVVYTESPANPTCRLTDLHKVGQIVDDHAAAHPDEPRPWVMCDSTFATPFHQRAQMHRGSGGSLTNSILKKYSILALRASETLKVELPGRR